MRKFESLDDVDATCMLSIHVILCIGFKGARETGGCQVGAVVVELGYRLGNWEWTSSRNRVQTTIWYNNIIQLLSVYAQ